MTPTLAMTVEREAAIEAFHPEPFYMVMLKMEDCMASSERFKEKAQAEELLAECRKSSRALVQKSERREKSERPPALYDLTTLQRDANRLLVIRHSRPSITPRRFTRKSSSPTPVPTAAI